MQNYCDVLMYFMYCGVNIKQDKNNFTWNLRISGLSRGGGLGCSNPPPKFRRYRWSPRSHKQKEPASRFPFI